MVITTTSQITRPPYLKVIVAQLLATLFIAALACSLSMIHGYSALLGGLICSLPNAWFAYRIFVYQGAQAAEQIVKSFYKAEAIKLALTALFFGLTFKFIDPLEPLMLFVAFFLVQTVHWLTPLLLKKSVEK